MIRITKTANVRDRRSWEESAGVDVKDDDPVLAPHATASRRRKRSPSAAWPLFEIKAGSNSSVSTDVDVAASPATDRAELSVRAENVLKELAMELTGVCPPKGRWIPSDKLLRKLTFRHLQAARNCGPQTTDEIVEWAGLRGVAIQPPFHDGKSLSAMWRDIIAGFSSGKLTMAEIAEALDRSARRKNTKIPVAIQNLLLKVLKSSGK
jgi:hypothetical protein